MRVLLSLTILLIAASVAHAGYYICGDTTKLGYYAQGIDPARVPPCAPPFLLSELPDEATIAQQDTLYRTVGPKHLKVLDGLMVEMTQAEKDIVNQPTPEQAAASVARNEMKTNEVCANHTLPEIDAYWKGPGSKQAQLQTAMGTFQTAINALAAGPPKTALQASYDALLLHMTMFIDNSNLIWRYVCSHGYVQP